MIIYRNASNRPVIELSDARIVLATPAKISLLPDGATIEVTSTFGFALSVTGSAVRDEAGDPIGTASEAFDYLETVFA